MGPENRKVDHMTNKLNSPQLMAAWRFGKPQFPVEDRVCFCLAFVSHSDSGLGSFSAITMEPG